MNAAHIYATITFSVAVMLLLGWFCVAASNPRWAKMAVKSIVLFALPIAGLVTVPASALQFPFALWVATLVDELLKAFAARSEKHKTDCFLLVTLYGIWELALVKPLWGLHNATSLDFLTNLQLVELTVAGTVTVLMHSVTAEIYAFRFNHRLPLALAVSWTLHTAFDELVGRLGVSLLSSLTELLLLALLFGALWPRGLRLSSC